MKIDKVFKNKYIYYLILTGIFLAASGKIFELQVVKGSSYNYLSNSNMVKYSTIYAPRGVIFDRAGNQIAYNVSSFSVWVDPHAMGEQEDEILEYIAESAEVDYELMRSDYDSKKKEGYREIVVLNGLEWDDGPYQLSIHMNELPGVRIEESMTREYRDPKFAQIVGYVGTVDKEDVDAGMDPNDTVGKAGVEQWYDSQLRGENGQRVTETNKMGQIVDSYVAQDAQSGTSVYLTLDAGLQERATQALADAIDYMDAAGGAVVIEDVRTGEILALVSLPSYDNEVFMDPSRYDELSALFTDPNVPLFNRAISGAYPPGSTFKTVTGAAGLQEGAITPTEKIQTGGTFEYGGVTFQDAGKRNWGSINIVDAYRVSSSIFFMKVALQIEGSDFGHGIEVIKDYANKFGLGVESGVDLPGEVAGAVACPELKEELHGEIWYAGDLLNASMGQGDHMVTPLQLASLGTALGNGGNVMWPHVVGSMEQDGAMQEVEPVVLRSGFVDDSNLAVVRQGMRKTVTSGIATNMNSSVVDIAVKTGTAESGRVGGDAHAFIMGFAPYDNPQIAFSFFVEAGGWSYEAARYAKPLIEWYFTDGPGKTGLQPIQAHADYAIIPLLQYEIAEAEIYLPEKQFLV